jgi:hypothetical protein
VPLSDMSDGLFTASTHSNETFIMIGTHVNEDHVDYFV